MSSFPYINGKVQTYRSLLITTFQELKSLSSLESVRKQKQIARKLLGLQKLNSILLPINQTDFVEQKENLSITFQTEKRDKSSSEKGQKSQKDSNKQNDIQKDDRQSQKLRIRQMKHLKELWEDLLQQLKGKILHSSIPENSLTSLSYLAKTDHKYNSLTNYGSTQASLIQKYDVNFKKSPDQLEPNGYLVQIAKREIELNHHVDKIKSEDEFKNKKTQKSLYSSLATTDSLFKGLQFGNQFAYTNIQSIRCWKCLPYFYQNGELIEETQDLTEKRYRNYCLGQEASEKVLDKASRDEIEEALCLALNYGQGYIYLGIKKASSSTKSFSKNSQRIQNFEVLKYKVEGIKIKKQLESHQAELLTLLHNYIANYIRPLTKLNEESIKIDYIPVVANYNHKERTNEDEDYRNLFSIESMVKDTYVIRIMVKGQMRKEVYFVETEKLENGSKRNEWNFFADRIGEYSRSINKEKGRDNNGIHGPEIYKAIVFKYYQHLENNRKGKDRQDFCVEFNYPIQCKNHLILPPETEQTHQNSMMQSETNYSSYANKSLVDYEASFHEQNYSQNPYPEASESLAYYSNYPGVYNPYQYPYHQYQYPYGYVEPINMIQKHLVPSKIPDYVADPQIFGKAPIIDVYNHNDILIVSPKGMGKDSEDKSMFEEFRDALIEMKIGFKLSGDLYLKMARVSVRSVYVLSHNKDYKTLNDIARKIDPQKRNLILLNLRKQMRLINPDNYDKAVCQLSLRFKQIFSANYSVAYRQQFNDKTKKQEINYYFAFKNLSHAIFAFVLLEYNNIRCDFVNQSQLQTLQLYEY